MGISVESREIEVRIRGHEVEDVVFLLVVPVFPAFVPAFYQKCVKAVLRRKIYVAADIFIVRAVIAVGPDRGIVGHTELNGRKLVGVRPLALPRNHLPPDAHIFYGMDPAHILKGAGLVEVEDKAGGEHLGRAFADLHRPPGRPARCLEPSFHPLCIRRKPGAEGHLPGVQVEVHRGIIHHFRFVKIDI